MNEQARARKLYSWAMGKLSDDEKWAIMIIIQQARNKAYTAGHYDGWKACKEEMAEALDYVDPHLDYVNAEDS